MEKKVSKRENFEAMIAYFNENGKTEWADVLTHEIELIDKRNAKAKERAATKRAEGDELTDAIFAAVTDEFQSIAAIADAVDVSAAKVTYRLNALEKAGKIEKGTVSAPDSTNKNRKVVAYKLPDAE